MRVRISQTNSTIGDLKGNLAIISQQIMLALQSKCDVVVFPELATVGYPPRDLLYSRALWENHPVVIDEILGLLRAHDHQLTVIVGGLHEQTLTCGRYARFNSAWILDRHYGKRVVHKRLLPCYDVFDETRYFTPEIGPYAPIPIHVVGGKGTYDVLCDVLICEDIWNSGFQNPDWLKPHAYATDPVGDLAGLGPLFVLNGSPFWVGKIKETRQLVESISTRLKQPVVWCNQVGAHDDVVTGGYSMVTLPPANPSSRMYSATTRMANAFQEDALEIILSDAQTPHSDLRMDRARGMPPDVLLPIPEFGGSQIDVIDFDIWTIYQALHLHMSDYKRCCGFEKAVIGLSGGIDSAAVAIIAVDVFGAENVIGVGMPSKYSSTGSIEDAQTLALNLGIRFDVQSIRDIHEATIKLFLSGAKPKFDNPVTDENIQPRVRGMVLMAYANDIKNCILLTTGNKSEISVGYCTLYGDLCGGLAVLSDVWKMQVYQLARFYNKYRGEVIPVETIDKPPSAELKDDQADTDSLLPYPLLDPLLQMFIEEELTPWEAVSRLIRAKMLDQYCPDPHSPDKDAQARKEIHRIYRMYRNSEHKRQQMPIGPKIFRRSFGAGRRMPIAMKLTTV